MCASSEPARTIPGCAYIGCCPGSMPTAEMSTPRQPRPIPRIGSRPMLSTVPEMSSAAWSTACPSPDGGAGSLGVNSVSQSTTTGHATVGDQVFPFMQVASAQQTHDGEPMTDALIETAQLRSPRCMAMRDELGPAVVAVVQYLGTLIGNGLRGPCPASQRTRTARCRRASSAACRRSCRPRSARPQRSRPAQWLSPAPKPRSSNSPASPSSGHQFRSMRRPALRDGQGCGAPGAD